MVGGCPQTSPLLKMGQEGIWKRIMQALILIGKVEVKVPSNCKVTMLKKRFNSEQDFGDILCKLPSRLVNQDSDFVLCSLINYIYMYSCTHTFTNYIITMGFTRSLQCQ